MLLALRDATRAATAQLTVRCMNSARRGARTPFRSGAVVHASATSSRGKPRSRARARAQPFGRTAADAAAAASLLHEFKVAASLFALVSLHSRASRACARRRRSTHRHIPHACRARRRRACRPIAPLTRPRDASARSSAPQNDTAAYNPDATPQPQSAAGQTAQGEQDYAQGYYAEDGTFVPTDGQEYAQGYYLEDGSFVTADGTTYTPEEVAAYSQQAYTEGDAAAAVGDTPAATGDGATMVEGARSPPASCMRTRHAR